MSVRVRVTAMAVVVTAAALALGGWGLVRSIERTRLGQIAAATEDRVERVVEQLSAGVPAERLQIVRAGDTLGPGLVQVLDESGDVLTASPAGEELPLEVWQSALPPPEDGSIIIAGNAGGGWIPEDAVATDLGELDLRFQTVETRDGDMTVVAASPLDEVRQSLDAVRRSLWIGLPLVVVMVGVVAWFVTGRALHPVEAMRAEAEAITHSTLHRRVPEPATADEVGRLARTMNAMLDRLELASERQRRFVADASHELRTPVATLRAELEVAQRAGDEAALRAAIDGALAEEARLEALLADLLLLASLEEAPPAGDETVDLGALAAAEAERPRRVPVTVTGQGTTTGSRRQLERVVTNLLDNAARHAATAVTVTVDGPRLLVDDDGPGVPEPDRPRIFERFTRLDEGRARDGGGSGLGLSIVAAVVAAHHGTVTVGDAPTGGARFAVDLDGASPAAVS